jgi:acyl-coenzyme A synthetase/AMP-(fatty) acid ligase
VPAPARRRLAVLAIAAAVGSLLLAATGQRLGSSTSPATLSAADPGWAVHVSNAAPAHLAAQTAQGGGVAERFHPAATWSALHLSALALLLLAAAAARRCRREGVRDALPWRRGPPLTVFAR